MGGMTMNKINSRWLVIAYLATFLLGIGLRVALIANRQVLEYDDAISYLMSTGHDGQYGQVFTNQSPPIGTWAAGSQWQRYLQIEDGLGYRQIAYDLAHRDVHPPLYYWLLHLWLSITSVNLWSGYVLNVLIDCVTALLLLWFANRYLRNFAQAALVSAIWLLSPVAIKTALWIRHYTFFTLIVVLFSFVFFEAFYRPQKISLWRPINLFLILLVVAGILTNYYFFIFVITGLLALALKVVFVNHDWKRVIYLVVCLGLGGLLFAFIHPEFYLSLTSYGQYNASGVSGVSDLAYRARFALQSLILLYSPFLFSLGLVIVACPRDLWAALSLRNIQHELKYWPDANRSHIGAQFLTWTTLFAVLPPLAVAGLYLVGFSQVHTISARYVSFLAPFVAYLPVFVWRKFHLQRRWVGVLWVGMVVLGLTTVRGLPWKAGVDATGLDIKSLHTGERFLLDSTNRGEWPSIAFQIPAESQVFANNQPRLLEQQQNWLPQLLQGGMYVSIIRESPNSQKGRAAILELIKRTNQVETISQAEKPGEWDIALYRIYPH